MDKEQFAALQTAAFEYAGIWRNIALEACRTGSVDMVHDCIAKARAIERDIYKERRKWEF